MYDLPSIQLKKIKILWWNSKIKSLYVALDFWIFLRPHNETTVLNARLCWRREDFVKFWKYPFFISRDKLGRFGLHNFLLCHGEDNGGYDKQEGEVEHCWLYRGLRPGWGHCPLPSHPHLYLRFGTLRKYSLLEWHGPKATEQKW